MNILFKISSCIEFYIVLFGFLNFTNQSFAQWNQTNGPYDGYVDCFAVSGTNLFAGSPGSGIFLSTSNGESWVPVNNGLTDNYVWSLFYSGTKLFAGTSSGMFCSIDNGSNWSLSGLTNIDVISIAVSGPDIIAGTLFRGVYRSTNNGSNWIEINAGLPPDVTVTAITVTGSNLFIGTYDGIFLSTNNGTNWTAISDIYVLAMTNSGGNLIAGGNGVFLSTNNGINWTPINSGLPNTSVSALIFSESNLFVGTINGVFRSSNNGANWTEVSSGMTNTNIAAFTTYGSEIFSGTFGGIFRSINNGNSWTSAGLPFSLVSVLAESGLNLFAGTLGSGLFQSTNHGRIWTPLNTDILSYEVYALAVYDMNIYAATVSGILLSTNNGTNWDRISYISATSLAVSGNNLFAGTDGFGVFLSTNNGLNWTSVNAGLTSNNVITLAVSPNYLFAGTSGGGVYRTSNNGTNWASVNSGLTISNIITLTVTETDLYAGTIGGIFRSSNNGSNWISVSSGLPANMSVYSIYSYGNDLFAGTYGGGVFLSTNSGLNWTAENEGLLNLRISSLIVSGNYLIAGTFGFGAWIRPLSEIISVELLTTILPSHFRLYQNYPNPFNPKTIITVQCSMFNFVSLKVYDVLGNLVSTLVNENKPAGSFEVEFDGNSFASGIYFYSLYVDGKLTDTKRMVLLK